MPSLPFYLLLVFLLLMMVVVVVHGNELSRCCAGGARHHREHGNCQAVRAVGSIPTCSRAGSICCLRALIDSHCQAGLVYAQRHAVCSTVIINELAGGIKRECCDCCLLAKELSDHGQQCVAPTGFSPDCLNAFNKCCNGKTTIGGAGSHLTQQQQSNGISSVAVSIGVDGNGAASSCATANCEHLCTTREDGTPQCSCRPGFDLAPDGRTCVDIDECDVLQAHWSRRKAARHAAASGQHNTAAQRDTQALLQLLPAIFRGMPLCDMSREICVNTRGGFGCRPARGSGGRSRSGGGKSPTALAATAIPGPAKLVAREEGQTQPSSKLAKIGGAGQRRRPTAGGGRRRQYVTASSAVKNARRKQLEEEQQQQQKMLAAERQKNGGNEIRAVVVGIGTGAIANANANANNESTDGREHFAYQTVNHPSGDQLQHKSTKTEEEVPAPAVKQSHLKSTTTTTVLDVDECTLGAHDCGPMYQCRNTQGSFRCVPKRCAAPDQWLDPSTGECKSINCQAGYRAHEGRCEDIDECKEQPSACSSAYEECVNTPGSFRCQEQGNLCTNGYFLDKESGFCLDVDECQRGTHTCAPKGECINLAGTFRCKCSTGFEFNEYTMRCEDINECVKFAGHACSLQADCVNTVGSFQCLCRAGFKLAADNRTCDDIDECASGVARCQQKCINSPGSYQCICDRGYQLGIDESTCEDIDECEIWAKSGNNLCMGKCINTPGSFVCTCPAGYQIMADGITCKDIDECTQQPLICPGDQLCINMLGSYRCQRVECPRNYLPDRQYKNKCVKKSGFCANLLLDRCKKYPIHISWQHIAIPKQINISLHRTSVTLFSMKGPTNPNSSMQFELRMVEAKTDFGTVTPAVRSNFLLQKGDNHNSATIALRDSLDGPQEVHLELTLRLTTNGTFNGKYIANLMVYVSQYRPQAQHERHHRLQLHHRNRDFNI